MTHIYALLDPRTNAVRYIGKATDLKRRLNEHLQEAKNPSTHRTFWIAALVRNGWEPIIAVIETVPKSEWKAAERRWIAHYHALGCNLTNGTDGGEGVDGHVHTPEVRAAISRALSGRKKSETTKANMSAGQRSRAPFPQETRDRIGAKSRGRGASEETRARLSAALRWYWAGRKTGGAQNVEPLPT